MTLVLFKLKKNLADDPGILIARASSTGMVVNYWYATTRTKRR